MKRVLKQFGIAEKESFLVLGDIFYFLRELLVWFLQAHNQVIVELVKVIVFIVVLVVLRSIVSVVLVSFAGVLDSLVG